MLFGWNNYRHMEGNVMEIFGLIILLVIGSIVVYYLDLHTTIWSAFVSFFETSKKQYVEFKQDRRDCAAEKRTRALKKAADAKKRTKKIFAQWRQEEDDRREAKKIEHHFSNAGTTFNDHIKVHKNGARSVDVNKLLRQPNVQRQLKEMQRFFRQETLRALYNGKEPPLSVGQGRWTKEKLEKEWDDKWQADLEEVGLKYEQFFGPKDQFVCSPRTRLDSDLGTMKIQTENTPKLTFSDDSDTSFGNSDTGFYESTLVLKSNTTNSGGPK